MSGTAMCGRPVRARRASPRTDDTAVAVGMWWWDGACKQNAEILPAIMAAASSTAGHCRCCAQLRQGTSIGPEASEVPDGETARAARASSRLYNLRVFPGVLTWTRELSAASLAVMRASIAAPCGSNAKGFRVTYAERTELLGDGPVIAAYAAGCRAPRLRQFLRRVAALAVAASTQGLRGENANAFT